MANWTNIWGDIGTGALKVGGAIVRNAPFVSMAVGAVDALIGEDDETSTPNPGPAYGQYGGVPSIGDSFYGAGGGLVPTADGLPPAGGGSFIQSRPQTIGAGETPSDAWLSGGLFTSARAAAERVGDTMDIVRANTIRKVMDATGWDRERLQVVIKALPVLASINESDFTRLFSVARTLR